MEGYEVSEERVGRRCEGKIMMQRIEDLVVHRPGALPDDPSKYPLTTLR